MNLKEVFVRPVRQSEEKHYQELMQEHHYLGFLPKISETLWYVATWRNEWLALMGFSAAAWKCKTRDRWIGWDFCHQYNRLKLLTNISIIKSKGVRSVAQKMRELTRNVRIVFDYLRMTKNSRDTSRL